LRAIGRLAAAGYPIRVRFSPVVPLRGWRDAYRDLLQRLAAVATPELVTLWALSMIELDELGRIVPFEQLDEEVLATARAAAPSMRGEKGAPFPPSTRASLYREIGALVRDTFPSTRLALCLERPEVWDAVGPLVVPHHRSDFVCNCGPRVTPAAVAL
jgi:spore photoproduct lyase